MPSREIVPLVVMNADTFAGTGRSSREPIVPDSPTRDQILAHLRTIVGKGRVLDAFKEVDRADFVPQELKPYAYSNKGGLQIREDLVLSQPSMVARMTEALKLEGEEKVLEVGAGAGYGAAILARLAQHVDTMEIDPQFAQLAESNLRNLGIGNVTVHIGNGRYGLPESAPFGAIILTAFAQEEDLPGLVAQLVPGGRIVVPVREDPFHQRLAAITKGVAGKTLTTRFDLGPVNFAPLQERAAPQA